MIVTAIYSDPARPRLYVVLDDKGFYWQTGGPLPGTPYGGDPTTLVPVTDPQARTFYTQWQQKPPSGS
jgi:hypothetical protein